jgi:hypothetical protein
MKRGGSRGALATVVIMVLGLALVGAFVAPLTFARSVPSVSTGTGAPQKLAYGGEEWQNDTVYTSSYAYTADVFYAWQYVTTTTNTSASTLAVEATSTTAYTYNERYCTPNCSSPTLDQHISASSWAVATSFVNLSSNAKVNENHSSVPALGVANTTSLWASNYSETYGELQNGKSLYTGSAYTGGNGSYALAFHPTLGLIPWNASKGQTWNSTSSYSGSYGWKTTYLYAFLGYGIRSVQQGTSIYSAPQSGTETIVGADRGNVTLSNGQNATDIDLGFQGPYNVSLGLSLAPSSTDLFNNATAHWSIGVLQATSLSAATLSVHLSPATHSVQVLAAGLSWRSTVRVAGPVSLPTLAGGSTAGLRPLGGTLQAQPESVAYANSVAHCLLGGCATSRAPGAVAPVPTGFTYWLAGASMTSLIAVLLYLRLRPGSGSATPSTSSKRRPAGIAVPPARGRMPAIPRTRRLADKEWRRGKE